MLPRTWDPTKHAGQDPTGAVLVPLDSGDEGWLFVQNMLRQTCEAANLVRLQRVQWPKLWGEFTRYRDDYLGGKSNERLLFHGTGTRSATELSAHPHGLDPGFSSGGFYGLGIYLAQEASYPLGGGYAHRVAGSGGTRLQLLLVRANLGTQQDLGQRIDSSTRAMKMPDARSDGGRFHSVRAGPHRPFLSGTVESSLDASVIHVVYESRQLYPQYVLEIEFDLAPEVAATTSAAAEAPPYNVGSSAAIDSRAGSSSSMPSAAPASPLSKRARHYASPDASAAAAIPIAPAGQLEALVAALVREGPPAEKTNVVVALSQLLSQADGAAREAIVAAGGIEALVALVRDGSPDGKAAAAGALHNLSFNNDGSKASIAAAGGIRELVALVRDGSSDGKAAAAAALRNLSSNHAWTSALIAAAGGIEALVALVRDGSPDSKMPAAGVLRNMSINLVALVRDSSLEGKAAAARALCNLSANYGAGSASIAAAGGIEALVELARDGSPDSTAAAAGVLCNLSYNNDGRSTSIVAAGGVEVLVALTCNGSSDSKAAAARALNILGFNHEERKALITAAGGIEALVALARDGSPDGKAAAAKALRNLANNHDGRQESIVVAGGIEMLVAVVRDSDCSPEGRSAAARALCNLSTNDGRKALIVAAGGREALVALARDGGSREFKEAVASALRLLNAARVNPNS